MRTPMKVEVSEADRRLLEKWIKSRSIPDKQKQRAKIVLLSSEGRPTSELMRKLKVSNPTLNLWRRRYQEEGIEALVKGRSRPSGFTSLPQEKVQEVLSLTVTGKPANATHWSCRSMAEQVGISKSAVNRIWQAHKLKPHQVKGFKVSNDKHFEKKLRDVVGLYLDPPEKAIVFSVDEKSQIQALDRTQPGLPLKRGKAGTMTHDYKRHGTTTLFAALNVHEGTVIGECLPKHRNDEFLSFLKRLDRETEKALDVHLIVDNYATHKHPNVKAWLEKHPRFHMHFTPTSASWVNLVERFFRDITEERIRRGVFRSVPELKEAIMDYLAHRNANPKPYKWTARPDEILAKVAKAKDMLGTLH
ncbi:MAG: IS630 family transposase [Lamprobacter sp.]|uniref:IS630 family transposase n=1 Tax=Lamprobacter sp. TaxID=3100796 RepID=UPI002B25C0A3|nr:IS630 family transposase [Lamprobacter sp.]MEA3643935.1 IS630 family transposase [Lamprobacter sp.]